MDLSQFFDFTFDDIVSFIIWILYFIGLYLFFFWMTVFISTDYKEKSKKKKKILDPKNYPNVSIVIPCYNEEKTIGKTLDSVFKLDYNLGKIEIICVNDGSKDNTNNILKKYSKKYSKFNFKIIEQKNQGKYIAMNNALKIIKNNYFLCLDADSYPEKSSLKILVSEFLQEKKDVVAYSPIMEVNNPKTLIQKLQWTEYALGNFFKYLASLVDSMMVISGPFSIYKTKIIKKIGGFNRGYLTEDFEIALRLQKNHYKIKNSLNAKVKTSSPKSIGALVRQRVRWNQGNFLCMKDYFKDFMFKKEFADFGLFVFPSMLLASFFLVGGFMLILILFFKNLLTTIYNLSLVNYDLIIYIQTYSFDFSFYDLNLKGLFLMFFIVSLLGFMFYISLRETKVGFSFEKFLPKSIIFIIFAFFYRLIMLWVWIIVFKRIVFRQGTNKWLR